MKKYFTHDLGDEPAIGFGKAETVYLASDVDTRIADLEKALRELNDLCVNASRNHMDIDPDVHLIVKAALGL